MSIAFIFLLTFFHVKEEALGEQTIEGAVAATQHPTDFGPRTPDHDTNFWEDFRVEAWQDM